MANTTGTGAAFCPYYVKEADKSLTCEGMVPGTLTATKFDSVETRQAYQEAACFSPEHYGLCPLAAMLDRLYDGSGHRKPLKITTLTATAKRPVGQRKAYKPRVYDKEGVKAHR